VEDVAPIDVVAANEVEGVGLLAGGGEGEEAGVDAVAGVVAGEGDAQVFDEFAVVVAAEGDGEGVEGLVAVGGGSAGAGLGWEGCGVGDVLVFGEDSAIEFEEIGVGAGGGGVMRESVISSQRTVLPLRERTRACWR